jgi:hypothetical protein
VLGDIGDPVGDRSRSLEEPRLAVAVVKLQAHEANARSAMRDVESIERRLGECQGEIDSLLASFDATQTIGNERQRPWDGRVAKIQSAWHLSGTERMRRQGPVDGSRGVLEEARVAGDLADFAEEVRDPCRSLLEGARKQLLAARPRPQVLATLPGSCRIQVLGCRCRLRADRPLVERSLSQAPRRGVLGRHEVLSSASYFPYRGVLEGRAQNERHARRNVLLGTEIRIDARR